MAWSTVSNFLGARTRGGVGNQQTEQSSSQPSGGDPAPSQPRQFPFVAPPTLRTSIGGGDGPPAAMVNAVIPQQRRRGALAWQYMHVVSSDFAQKPQPMPAFRVPAGATVRVRATNGLGAGNASPIFVGLDYWTVLNAFNTAGTYTPTGRGSVLMPLDDVELSVANTAEIWVLGVWKDGVVISVNRIEGYR